jgi:molecular chaperone GrpE
LECADKEFYSGLKGIHVNLTKLLEGKGLRPIPTDGSFDPALHEALCTCEGEENGKILEVYQKGYFLGSRVLRHAKVLVSKKNNNKEGE